MCKRIENQRTSIFQNDKNLQVQRKYKVPYKKKSYTNKNATIFNIYLDRNPIPLRHHSFGLLFGLDL